MNVFQAVAITNIGLFICVGLVTYITKSPWALLGLAFILTGKRTDDDE